MRWVDWPLSARVGEPMVRVPEIEPVLTAWALVDCSPSMAYGSEVRTKLEPFLCERQDKSSNTFVDRVVSRSSLKGSGFTLRLAKSIAYRASFV